MEDKKVRTITETLDHHGHSAVCFRTRKYKKWCRFKDTLEVLSRPEEHMKVYYSDGSWAEFTSGFGTVMWTDSRKLNEHHNMEANSFVRFHFQI